MGRTPLESVPKGNGSLGTAAADRIRLQRVAEQLPAGFDALRAAARAEGYRHLERLATEWTAGTMRFDREGEALLAARVDGELAGIGGLTIDPWQTGALRMRRFYVRSSSRRNGVGRAMAANLLRHARSSGLPVTVNATAGSELFWEALGFISDARNRHTHLLSQLFGSMTGPGNS